MLRKCRGGTQKAVSKSGHHIRPHSTPHVVSTTMCSWESKSDESNSNSKSKSVSASASALSWWTSSRSDQRSSICRSNDDRTVNSKPTQALLWHHSWWSSASLSTAFRYLIWQSIDLNPPNWCHPNVSFTFLRPKLDWSWEIFWDWRL